MRRGELIVAGACLIALGTLACSGEEYETARADLLCPDRDVYRQMVSPYIERRCGSLDCHGARERPLRLYGRFGQRHPTENNVSGGAETTPLEREANFASVCGLEPEKMSEALDDFGQSAAQLLIVSKPRGIVSHKGGQVILEGDAADQCIVKWIRQDPPEQIEGFCASALDQID